MRKYLAALVVSPIRRRIADWWEKEKEIPFNQEMLEGLSWMWWATGITTIAPSLYMSQVSIKWLWLFGGPMIFATALIAAFHIIGIIKETIQKE